MSNENLPYYDDDALLYRLNEGVRKSNKRVVFIVGSPLTAPYKSSYGVADVEGVLTLIRSQFEDNPKQLSRLDTQISKSRNRYQEAVDFLSSRAGQDAVNGVVKTAVAGAWQNHGERDLSGVAGLPDDSLRSLEQETSGWVLAPGNEALGNLIARFPERFGKHLLTSNFDPLMEISIRKAGGSAWRTSLSSDGSIFQSEADGCQVIHIHGNWFGTDTLHTNRQLLQLRPSLKNDILRIIEDNIVVVVAYGGWSDIFTDALASAFKNENFYPEVLWTFFGDTPDLSGDLQEILQPGIDRNRVTLYCGIDCNTFFPSLLELWDVNSKASPKGSENDLEDADQSSEKHQSRKKLFRLPPLECDRPPAIDVWVGRERELRALEATNANVIMICGIGGEGKSVLASHYITNLDELEGDFRAWDWRDCKEQSDRIRTQIVEVISRFSQGCITSEDLQDSDDEELVEVLVENLYDSHSIVVFDNVDSYVDLENGTFVGLLDLLVKRMCGSQSSSRLILTCRPTVQYPTSSAITFPISGITKEEAVELFQRRAEGEGVTVNEAEVHEAHALTNGNAFWLNLIAIQAFKVPGNTLRNVIDGLRRGREGAPDVLSSIWDKLALREKTLLRLMAEAVRPETSETIARIAATKLNHKNFSRALRSLCLLNLVVVKAEENAPDLYDLHPLVRQFVRKNYAPAERSSFIRVVINQYKVIIGTMESLLGIHLPFAMLERWSQKAELEISAGMFSEAFETLHDVEDALIGGGHAQEFVRVCRTLFESIDWETASSLYVEFDNLVGVYIDALNELGDFSSADATIERYTSTIPQKTARYIKLCDIRTYTLWQRGEFQEAIEWGQRGVDLKKESKVDTHFDCEHNLALARRDAGEAEVALEAFLRGSSLEQVLKDDSQGNNAGAMFGNIGRCLQLLGRIDEALPFYRKSLRALEQDTSSNSRSNRAYGRRWVGQVLREKGEVERAEAFFMDAIRLLSSSAPVRVREIYEEIKELRPSDSLVMSDEKASRIVRNWFERG